MRVGAHPLQELTAVLLRGLGQLALVETVSGGVLVLSAITLINPWCALGAACGVLLGTLVGYRYTGLTREEWRAGMGGFNGAVIGIMAGGLVATDSGWPGAVFLAAMFCLMLEFTMRRVLTWWKLPVLSMPAVLSLMLTSLMLAPSGTWLWVSLGLPALGATGIALAIVCVVLAMAGKSLPATLQLVVLSCMTILVGRWRGIDPLSMIGLWAFTIAPASFTVHSVFMGGSLLGGVAGCVAAVIGGGIWILWSLSGVSEISPPLLAPFIIGVWCAVLIFRRLGQPVILQPAFWQALTTLVKARLQAKCVVVLIGNTPNHDLQSVLACSEAVAIKKFKESRKVRQMWWQTCHDFREGFKQLAPEPIHYTLERLQRRHWLDAFITFAMDGCLQRVGTKHVVEAQGSLQSVRCLGCGNKFEWPPADIWRTCDLHCSKCGNQMMPGPPELVDVISSTWQSVSQSLDRGGVLLVLGTLEDLCTEKILFDAARLRDARIINITPVPAATPLCTGEILVRGDTGGIVHCFERVLSVLSLANSLPGTGFVHARIEAGRNNS